MHSGCGPLWRLRRKAVQKKPAQFGSIDVQRVEQCRLCRRLPEISEQQMLDVDEVVADGVGAFERRFDHAFCSRSKHHLLRGLLGFAGGRFLFRALTLFAGDAERFEHRRELVEPKCRQDHVLRRDERIASLDREFLSNDHRSARLRRERFPHRRQSCVHSSIAFHSSFGKRCLLFIVSRYLRFPLRLPLPMKQPPTRR